MTPVITRKEYLADSANLHRAYYAQFVTLHLRHHIAERIGMDRLRASTDPHLNDIPIQEWERLTWMMPLGAFNRMRATGDTVTQSGMVCVLKEAARQAIEHDAEEELKQKFLQALKQLRGALSAIDEVAHDSKGLPPCAAEHIYLHVGEIQKEVMKITEIWNDRAE